MKKLDQYKEPPQLEKSTKKIGIIFSFIFWTQFHLEILLVFCGHLKVIYFIKKKFKSKVYKQQLGLVSLAFQSYCFLANCPPSHTFFFLKEINSKVV